ncbi:MAG: aldo/keto reductase [Candidatus Methylacidiphilales bacterium]
MSSGSLSVPRRRFGRTELAMPVLTCGGMRYQHSWQDTAPGDIPSDNQANLEATIHRALDAGICHIETARGYGSSEMQLGRLLPRLPRDSMIVQTKIAPHEDPSAFAATFEKSMSLLGLDYVDLLSIHGINNDALLETALTNIPYIRTLQKQGRVRHLGFSTHASCGSILRTLNTGEFDYVNLHWYWIFQENEPAVRRASELDMGVFIISPNDKGGRLYEPTRAFSDGTAPLSPMIFNNLFCLNRQEVHTLSIGAARPSDFDEHLKTFAHWEQRSSLVSQAESALLGRIEKTIGRDWWFHFAEGLPDWEHAPDHINIKLILWLWSLDQALDMREYAKQRYGLLGNAGHWFPGEKAANLDGIDWQAVLSGSRFADVIPTRLQEAHAWFGGEEKKRLSQS